MKWLFQLVVLLVAVLIQVQLPASAWLGQVKCPVVLSCILYYALAHDRAMWMVGAVMGGVLIDAMSTIPVGFSSFLYLGLGWVASRFRRRLVLEAAMTSIVLGAILNLIATCGSWIFLQHTDLVHLPWNWGLVTLLAAAVLGAVISPVVCGLLGSLEHTLGNRERSTGYA